MLALSIIQFTRDADVLPVSAYPPRYVVRRGKYALYRHPIYLFYVTSFIPSKAPFFLVANHRNYLNPFFIAETRFTACSEYPMLR